MRIRYVDPQVLKPHTFNQEIYGDAVDADFVASIREEGVKAPLRVLPGSMTIISGHRRRDGAIMAGVELVPVMDADELLEASEEEIRLAILNENLQREKTTETKAREYAAREAIEKKLARGRQSKAGGAEPGSASENFSEALKGEAKARAAKAVGLSRPTAEKAKEVVNEIDAATASGDKQRAEELREELNQGTVAAAHRKAKAPQKPADDDDLVDAVGNKLPKKLLKPFGTSKEFGQILGKLKVIVDAVSMLADRPGGERIALNQLLADIGNIRRQIRFAEPYAVCPYCYADMKSIKAVNDQKDCKACKGLGWVGEETYTQAPADLKE